MSVWEVLSIEHQKKKKKPLWENLIEDMNRGPFNVKYTSWLQAPTTVGL